jgi:acetyltransferase-like isoleucine patch superfamily enzyme
MPALGGHGYTLPTLDGLTWRLLDGAGSANWLLAPQDLPDTTIILDGNAANNIVVIGHGAALKGTIRLQSTDGFMVIAGNAGWQPCILDVRLSSPGNGFFLGAQCKSNGLNVIVEGGDMHACIGDDCMFAWGAAIRTSDLHGMVEMASGSWINRPESVHLEPHVWMGQDSLALAGAHLGFGSVIGAKALVKRQVPRYSIVGGVPARLLRSGVSWDEGRSPAPDLVGRLRAYEALLSGLAVERAQPPLDHHELEKSGQGMREGPSSRSDKGPLGVGCEHECADDSGLLREAPGAEKS